MDKGGRARSPTKPGRAELWRLGALAALGAWTIVIPYLGHAFGLGVDVPSKKEIVDHFVPGASVLLDTLEATQAAGPALWPASTAVSVLVLSGWMALKEP